MYWIYYICLVAVLFTGLFAVVLSLPGIWVMILGALAYAWSTGWVYMGWKTLVVLTVIGVIAEIVETAAGGAGAKREGASRRGIFGAIVGGVVGGIFLSFLIPIPVLGTIIGACLGSLVGAMVVELYLGKNLEHSLRIGVGAAKGRFVGILSKLGFGILVLIICLWMALPLGAPAPALALPSKPAAPTTLPASMPTTLPTTNP
jgi:uncharacterized protein YqgC (DUF456 family)